MATMRRLKLKTDTIRTLTSDDLTHAAGQGCSGLSMTGNTTTYPSYTCVKTR